VNPLNLLLVALGGALGSAARYALSAFVLRASGTLFPLGTFAVNLLGCIAFGVIAGATEQRVAFTPAAKTFLLVGILGGFTTFSSYAFESFALVRNGQLLPAAVNIVGQVVMGLAGVAIGFALGAWRI
jgi:fluoride exporter